MNIIEIEATRKEIFRMLLNVDDEKILVDIKHFLCGTDILYPEVPFHYNQESLLKMVNLSEDAISTGQVTTSEQLRNKH
jgi:hypothetical protein